MSAKSRTKVDLSLGHTKKTSKFKHHNRFSAKEVSLNIDLNRKPQEATEVKLSRRGPRKRKRSCTQVGKAYWAVESSRAKSTADEALQHALPAPTKK